MNRRLQASTVLPLALAAFAAFAATSFGAAQKATAAPSTIRGNVDIVRKIQGGKVLELFGWAADFRTGSVQKVEIRLNDKPVGLAQLGLGRVDVARTFRRNDLLKSGWTAKVDLSRMPPGTYRVSAQAWSGVVSAPLAMGKVEFRVP